MILYGIGILPLIKNLKREIPDTTHPWYTDNFGDLGMFARIATYFDSLTRQVPGRRYYTKPSKIILNICPEYLEDVKSSGHVTDLRCAWAHVILGVTPGTTSPNTIG